MIHLYYGDGKGKTTCAIGLSVRALGNGFPVIFVQFLKSRQAGEIRMLENLGAKIIRGKGTLKFTFQMTDDEKKATRKISIDNFNLAIESCKKFENEKHFFLIFDEICSAWNNDFLDKSKVESFLSNLPKNCEMILTGRNPPDLFLKISDYVTEMKKEKHPFDKGVKARIGVEF